MALQDVTVTLLSGAITVATDTTDINGDYDFADVPCGTYTLRFSKAGYETKDVTGVVVTNATNTVSDTCIQTPCDGDISGTIQYDNGVTTEPVSGKIKFINKLTGFDLRYDLAINGTYSAVGVPCGVYGVLVEGIVGDGEFIPMYDATDEITVNRDSAITFNKTYTA